MNIYEKIVKTQSYFSHNGNILIYFCECRCRTRRMLPVKLVTFDVTGTLLFFRTPIFEKYLQIALKFGVKADANVVKENLKLSWKTLNEEHPNFGKGTGLHWKMWWKQIVQRTFKGYVKPGEENKLSDIVEDLIAFHSTKEAFTKRPGTDDLLEYLKKKSIKLGVISNYDPRLTQILDFMEIKNYFDFILVSYEFGYSKPDVRIFEEALRVGGCVSRDETIHIGDDLELDYLGAKRAGLRAVLISSDEKDLNNCKVNRNEVFEDFLKLKTFFQQLD